MVDEEEATQPTQVPEENDSPAERDEDINSELDQLWGYLQPWCSASFITASLFLIPAASASTQSRHKFYKDSPQQTVGRHKDRNTVVLSGGKISNLHALITWDEVEGRNGMVTIVDKSTNGTWINGERVKKGNFVILRDGTEIGFGTSSTPPSNPNEDYRFIFRFTASGTPLKGIYAQYDINHELGRGTFATVMKAVHRTSGRAVAVKMVHRQLQRKVQTASEAADGTTPVPEDSKASNSFKREISIMEKMVHPNICSLIETFWEDDSDARSSYRCYLVLELVDGGDLLDYIADRGGLKELPAKQITYQMCRALQFIHKMGVAHRDLKPENVLLTKDHPPIAKVADFGLAKALDSMTMLRTMCGTPSYLAPEVVTQGPKNQGYDLQVDSWSVGVIVYSMLTNAGAFIEDEEETNMAERIKNRYIDWNTLAYCLVTPECTSFIAHLLETQPQDRLLMTRSLDDPWFNGYEPPPHHRMPINYDPNEYLAKNKARGGINGRRAATQLPAVSRLLVTDDSLPGPSTGQAFREDERTPSPPALPTTQPHVHGLQRRSEIWRRAQEDPEHNKIPEPNAEMILRYAMLDHSPGPSKPLKRGANEMEEDDAALGVDYMDVDPRGQSMGKSPMKGKGKSKAAKISGGSPRRSARVRTRNA